MNNSCRPARSSSSSFIRAMAFLAFAMSSSSAIFRRSSGRSRSLMLDLLRNASPLSHRIAAALHAGGKGLVVAAHVGLILRHRLVVGIGLLPALLVAAHQSDSPADAGTDRGTLARIAGNGAADRADCGAACRAAQDRRSGMLIAVILGRRLVRIHAG